VSERFWYIVVLGRNNFTHKYAGCRYVFETSPEKAIEKATQDNNLVVLDVIFCGFHAPKIEV